eukprot:CAMPEP_0174327084 /NCGR_PEP_ID=MMETSP0810-20121108/14307_1 /TAXON_ID=73025 ORGANISM="Eutreptiella gymnastica-like, Strain CCMP1594" /NCGR_SAMPLE_ID=MMETSP0810 /ASSEMBLY_ACC=CAM_ASM_000659 /LENGTH=72 /DNA_ID=CAMNT_0015440865 /DNA_START=54 /DNA_END=272 /DNA_ORIENTATION=+
MGAMGGGRGGAIKAQWVCPLVLPVCVHVRPLRRESSTRGLVWLANIGGGEHPPNSTVLGKTLCERDTKGQTQ